MCEQKVGRCGFVHEDCNAVRDQEEAANVAGAGSTAVGNLCKKFVNGVIKDTDECCWTATSVTEFCCDFRPPQTAEANQPRRGRRKLQFLTDSYAF